MQKFIDTAFGRFAEQSRSRLDLTYDYETSAIHSFKKILEEIRATVMLDVGANIGVYSIFCSSLPSLSSIHALEPAPETYKLLDQNIRLQERNQIFQAHRVAASSKFSSVKFKIVSALSGANSVVNTTTPDGTFIDVDAMPIDDLINCKSQRIGIKIDVEGHENECITGMQEIITSNECFLQIESLRHERKIFIDKILKSFGYKYLFSLRDDHLYISSTLQAHIDNIYAILSNTLSFDLRDLMYLRREKREIAMAARKLREMSSYTRNPLFLPLSENPFIDG